MVAAWPAHLGRFMYASQLQCDRDHRRAHALNGHTELISILCDSRIGIDPTPLWSVFDHAMKLDFVQQDYRDDDCRGQKYEQYAVKLNTIWNARAEEHLQATRLIHRIVKQIELKQHDWVKMPPIGSTRAIASAGDATRHVEVFYSYSHKDEELRNLLQTHLSMLRRQGVIQEWHDTKITGGTEWKGRIDQHLESAHVILLLVSADFLASDYCFDIELARASCCKTRSRIDGMKWKFNLARLTNPTSFGPLSIGISSENGIRNTTIPP